MVPRTSALVVVVIVLVALAGAYASGAMLFWRLGLSLADVSVASYARYWWFYRDHPRYGAVVRGSGVVGFGASLCVALGAGELAWSWPRRRLPYGDARFARLGELRRHGMLGADDTAIVVGRLGRRYLFFNGQQFAILAAPTRSGKGVAIVVPNLLSYRGSVVVLDIKRENFDLTSGFRAQHGQAVYLFNPFAEDLRTHRWNPLGYVVAPDLFVSH